MRRLLLPLFLLASVFASAQFDSYGGRTDMSCTPSVAGRFNPVQVGSRWYMCDPAGHLWYGMGVYNVGPQNGFHGTAAPFDATALRLKTWKFNFLGPYNDVRMSPWKISAGNKMPLVEILKPGHYGMKYDTGAIGTLDGQALKDIQNGRGQYYSTFVASYGIPDWSDSRYMIALDYMLTHDPDSTQDVNYAIVNNASLDYLIGLAIDDSDWIWGFWGSGANDPFDTQPGGHGGPHGGYLVAIWSPQQHAHASKGLLYTDGTVYVKQTWADFLKAKYGTISALNTAWGSTYSACNGLRTVADGFGSCQTQVAHECFSGGTYPTCSATTDGTNYSFTKTLANGTVTPNSIQVYDDTAGAMIAGDCYHPNSGDTCNPGGGTASGGVYGPTASGGSINYSTKSITISYSGKFIDLASLVCTSGGNCLLEVNSNDDSNFAATVGGHVTVTNSTCCSLTNETVSAKSILATCSAASGDTTQHCYTYTTSNSLNRNGSEGYGSGARDHAASITPPVTGHALSVSYATGGWEAGGNGLLDEDNRPAHTQPNVGGWLPSDHNNLGNSSTSECDEINKTPDSVRCDMRAFLYSLGKTYFSTVKSHINSAFSAYSRNSVLYFGFDTMGTWTSVPRKEVMLAAKGNVDVMLMGGAAGYTLTQSMLDFTAQWFNGPIMSGSFMHSNPDSYYNQRGFDSEITDQNTRGETYYSVISNQLATSTSAGVNPFLGNIWWQYNDNQGEVNDWGLVDPNDNAYDGNEDSFASVACSAPFNSGIYAGLTCGSMPAYPTWSAGMTITYSPGNANYSRIRQAIGGTTYTFEASQAGAAGGSPPAWSCTTPGTTTVNDGTGKWTCLGAVVRTGGYGDVISCGGTPNCGVTSANQLWLSLQADPVGHSVGSGRIIGGGRTLH